MTPAARIQAAIEIVDEIGDTGSTEQALTRWARRSRFAGSKDRAGIRDIVYDVRRRWDSCAIAGQGTSSRARVLGLLYLQGIDPSEYFTGIGHAPAGLGPQEHAGDLAKADVMPDMPAEIFAILVRDHGQDGAQDMARLFRDRAPTTLRVHSARSTPEEVAASLASEGILTERHPEVGSALIVTQNARRVASSAAYLEGWIELQDAASQKAALAVPAGDKVLDYCAGGGGKSLALAARADVGDVFAHDIDPDRMGDLPKRAARARDRVSVLSTKDLPGKTFDTVVVDAPCTGSGTWRRAPDAKWALTAQKVEGFAERQMSILTQAADHVGGGGTLCYMTCSVFRTENQDMVDRFLKAKPEWSGVSGFQLIPDWSQDGFFFSTFQRQTS